jgi:hypothetical protein
MNQHVYTDADFRDLAIQSNRALFDLVNANKHLIGATLADYPVSGSFAWATAFVYSTLATNPTLDYSTGEKVTFYGTAWGVGLGGGKLWTTGSMTVPASQLIGSADFTIGVAGGLTTINFSRNGSSLGTVVGAGLSVGVTIVHGSGEFKSN